MMKDHSRLIKSIFYKALYTKPIFVHKRRGAYILILMIDERDIDLSLFDVSFYKQLVNP